MRSVGADGEQSEAAWQEQIVQTAELSGWAVHHVYDSRRSVGDGFPDLVLAKEGQPVLYAELKRHNGVVSREQRHWLGVLTRSQGTVVYLWRAPRLRDSNALWLTITRILAHGPSLAADDVALRWVVREGDIRDLRQLAAERQAKRMTAHTNKLMRQGEREEQKEQKPSRTPAQPRARRTPPSRKATRTQLETDVRGSP